jgi:oligopeptide/dipeptide ABC transporter ATP-binding protein
VRALAVHYPERRRGAKGERQWVRAVDGVSLTVGAHETVGLVGESGCGKTTLAHAVLRLVPATAGSMHLLGADLFALEGEPLRRMRRRMQLVPQDAGASLTPHLTAAELVAEGLEVHGLARGRAARARAQELLAEVGLPTRAADARAAELSSGERQRVAIARALAPEPALLVCDEPVASVDASTRGLLLDLFERLRRDRGVALLLISHDLASVRRLADRVLVMYGGRLVESGPAAEMLDAPRMPYTQALLSAVPTGDPADRARRIVLSGEPPSALSPPAGCPFHPRCPHPMKDAQCAAEAPPLRPLTAAHEVACWKA